MPLESVPIITTIGIVCMFPASAAARPSTVVLGHAIGFVVAWLALLLEASPLFASPVVLLLMLLTGQKHPPAVLTPFVAAAHPDNFGTISTVLACGVIAAAVAGHLLRSLLRRLPGRLTG